MKVIKRNGDRVDFDPAKIQKAIETANDSVEPSYKKITKTLINQITSEISEDYISKNRTKTVEYIADQVEKKLIDYNAYETAKEYITYRYLHSLARNKYDDLMDAIETKLNARDVQNQNANLDERSFGGRTGEMANMINKQFALDYLLSDTARNNHINNMIYTHDLDSYAVGSHNCMSIPFDDLLKNGFKTKQTDVRPAGSVNTAFQLVAVIFQLQSLQQFGGVSATHLDWTMVPYVRMSFLKHYNMLREFISEFPLIKNRPRIEVSNIRELSIDDCLIYKRKGIIDKLIYKFALKLTKKEVHQAAEGMYHNLNTLQSRSGNQLPFTSVNYGTCTLPEGRMVTNALLDVSFEGLGSKHRTSIFPCGIFQCMNGINRRPGEPNYDLFKKALKSTAQRLYPNYANVDWSGNVGYDINDPRTYFSTMGCRTANGWDINGLGQLKDGRGNICPVTIIMPELAMQAKAIVDNWDTDCEKPDYLHEFLRILNIKIHEAKDQLIERFEWICSQSFESARFMYENNVMAGYIPEEGIRSALKHGTLAIGQLGLAETLQILIGCDHTEELGMQAAKQIEQLFKTRCAEFKEQYKLNFGVYYTPAENLCKTAMIKFKEMHGEIPNVSDREYFTNSMHVPVWKDLSIFEKIDIESQLTGYSSAGCITYVELESSTRNNLEALETIVNYAMDKDIPYAAINVPNDFCEDCGYNDEFNDYCPQCGSSNIIQLRRVTGYLSQDYRNFNSGKVAEVLDRVKHSYDK